MATATRAHRVVNPGRRHLSAKQIRAAFGGKRRKASLKKNRHRPRAKPRANKVRVAKNRARHTKRRNPDILHLIATTPHGNPAGRGRKMAATKRKHHKKRSSGHRRSGHRKNPGRAVSHYKHHNIRHHRRRNAGMNIAEFATQGLFAAGGLVGSRLLTQAVLGASNVGAMGYAGNAAATAALAIAAHFISKNPKHRDAVIIGGVLGMIARGFQDFSPLGGWFQQAGFGDYAGGGAHGVGVYLPWNGVVAQRYRDALNSAEVEIPRGWAPTVQVLPAAATKGVGALYGGGFSLY